jgi:hypothetical protein
MEDCKMTHTPYYYWRRLLDNFKGAKGCSVHYRSGSELSLQYHDTTVAHYNLDTGLLTLDHGGWRTYYTKERINRFCDVLGLDVHVYQHRKRFQVGHGDVYAIDWGHVDDGDAPIVAIETGCVPCS